MIQNADEENKYYPAILLDISEAFDRVSVNYYKILKSYLPDRKLQVAHEEACSHFYSILVEAPPKSV